jgi:hypothetical protein
MRTAHSKPFEWFEWNKLSIRNKNQNMGQIKALYLQMGR